MKKIATVLAVGLALSSAAAMASDGTVYINGELTTNTCTINGGNGDITVTLPVLSTSKLTAAGQVGGQAAFTMKLTACTGSTAHAYFESGAHITSDTNGKGVLKNTGAATNVAVQLMNNFGDVLDLNLDASGQDPHSYTGNTASGSADVTYHARYLALGATTAGLVTASSTYFLNYN